MENAGRRSIFIGAGANLAHPTYGSPRETLETAFRDLAGRGVEILRVSPWYRTAPVPASDQPWYQNAVIDVGTDLSPDKLLATLHDVEQVFGRVRTVANAARVIDLDLLDFCGEIASGGPGRATLPHPRLTERAFVLRPLADLCPGWRHPVTGEPIQALLAALPADQATERL
ncbi:MAG: 2-amino-4-hydroxy-6-hydroxymethyldihydropteridine diphosphokinase [Reyranella sp.]|uniref:2-amino-4-hydroxy-6- hydroxymethyldihydropteridine diphosphokinase n=1 Tax=Reyranella sp. TaxID=1929291 RepID=UPI00272F2043|nr:2-amino-4-hydroxy-6-hydroxymethyldihydropteridine diphosphokinase [Reyranella sp.]MDP1961520.1 2-amino-4-hydroxy-6-hydroxymethyldihydropteridine diphosphokinase [Reyranella sp.]MDP2373199.1 2-amino-4-hydroxy-6-hydroxymethyldihydropteridine diphosphokinase [Reyranella sp.]